MLHDLARPLLAAAPSSVLLQQACWHVVKLCSSFDLPTQASTHIKRQVRCWASRSRAYADRAYSAPPSIDNAAQHPFLAQFEGEGEGPLQAGEGDSEAGSAQPSRAATPVPQAARSASAAKASPAKAAAAPEKPPVALFDLLSMDDVRLFLALHVMTPGHSKSMCSAWPSAVLHGGGRW